jgi:hypothetical protein
MQKLTFFGSKLFKTFELIHLPPIVKILESQLQQFAKTHK